MIITKLIKIKIIRFKAPKILIPNKKVKDEKLDTLKIVGLS